jgi:hypothetical protein
MAYLVIVVNSPNDSISELNQRCQFPTKVHVSIDSCSEYLEKIVSGNKAAVVQVTTRDTDPAVATHGTGSLQKSYSKL